MQPQASDINSEKVERIKQAIKDGTLQMNTEKVADGILRDAHEFMLSMK
ncbi:flagellar biosynthesis anti-sigma factor FlgM [Providencia stuartii]|nr:flagellar biosynthesis anti-sigma factor FlgM [Providencia stuartii]WAZ82675.1 flagellar biosynthesis anti-sigma factor FlgM [Providencia stuartii]